MFALTRSSDRIVRMLSTVAVCLSLLLAAGLSGCGGGQDASTDGGDTGAAQQDKLQIALIPKGTAHPYWKAVHAGAVKAAREMNLNIIWNGPPSERARQQQIEIVQNFTARGVDGIVLAPLDSTALVRPVQTAVNRGIPVVIIDSGLETDAYSSFVSTDNYKGGTMAAKKLGKLMDGEGRALMMRYSPGSASTENREQGFVETLQEKYPDIKLVSKDQYAGVTREEAIKTAQDLISNYPDIEGIFCPNEPSAFGMMRVLEKRDKSKERIKFVGFDASEDLINGMEEGLIDALVAQHPFKMGYTGVEMVHSVIKGKKVPKRKATPSVLVTPDNLDDPRIQQVINPPVEKYLD